MDTQQITKEKQCGKLETWHLLLIQTGTTHYNIDSYNETPTKFEYNNWNGLQQCDFGINLLIFKNTT